MQGSLLFSGVWNWLAAALKNQLGASLYDFMFSDDKLVV